MVAQHRILRHPVQSLLVRRHYVRRRGGAWGLALWRPLPPGMWCGASAGGCWGGPDCNSEEGCMGCRGNRAHASRRHVDANARLHHCLHTLRGRVSACACTRWGCAERVLSVETWQCHCVNMMNLVLIASQKQQPLGGPGRKGIWHEEDLMLHERDLVVLRKRNSHQGVRVLTVSIRRHGKRVL